MSLPSLAAAQLLRLLPRHRLSALVGGWCERPLSPGLSRFVTGQFARRYRIDLSEVTPRSTPYSSFDEFFTRPLRDGARPVSADALVSPADGLLCAAGRVSQDCALLVKKQRYSVAELIGNEADAARYEGGSFGIVYLSPRDYHRVHCPAEGSLTLIRSMGGELFPVNSIGERHVPGLLAKNLRVAFCIDTETLGRVTLVMVGALIVGRITATALPDPAVPAGTHWLTPPRAVKRGEELGRFHLGSTTVLLVEPGHKMSRREGRILYGQSLVEEGK